jgi:2-succinyl-5-enolpyruvyl-6-hydroxy-3-cyclohexene-1-carboxylate synthase
MASVLESTYRLLAECAAICARHGVRYAVLSPGSRSAPVALSFLRNKGIQCFVLPDERSAAYTALGIARQTGTTAALVCTSGTAVLNYAPAVAEAWFSQIPLLVLTADRPQEWIAQADNQSIFQQKIYGDHVKAAFNFPIDHDHSDSRWYALRILNEALNIATSGQQGPVHINIPLREPLYLDYTPEFETDNLPIIRSLEPTGEIIPQLPDIGRTLIVAGLYHPAWGNLKDLKSTLKNIIEKGAAFLPDITSNLHDIPGAITFADLILNFEPENSELEPETLITFGGPVISKPLKEFLRRSPIKQHFHIGMGDVQPDTYRHLSAIIKMRPLDFFQSLQLKSESRYNQAWQDRQSALISKTEKVLDELPWSETGAVYRITRQMPENTILHLGNSMTVRHVSAFPFLKNAGMIFSNRGTSGIDGSVSAAAGHSMTDDTLHLLITGDLSFMYDSNGLWNNYLRPNLKIVVLNNHGGGIFRELPGPAAQPEREDYFVVRQPMNFGHLAKQFNCRYFLCDSNEGLNTILPDFYSERGRISILELDFTNLLRLGEIRKKIADLS